MLTRALLGFLLIVTCTIDVSAQKGKAPFTILIVTPDSARVDADIEVMFSLMEHRIQQHFYKSSSELAANTDIAKTKSEKANLGWQFDLVSNLETKFKNIKFYQVVSKYACLAIVEILGKGDRTSIAEVTLDHGRKRILYDSLPFDLRWQYLLTYKQLVAKKDKELITFSGTISVLDIKRNQVILEQDFTGKSNNRTRSWNCSDPAECAVYDFIRITSQTVVNTILNNQK